MEVAESLWVSASSSSVDRRRLLPEDVSCSGSVMAVFLLEANELVAGCAVKLLSALGRVVSGSIVASMISQASCGKGDGLRLRSPSPFTGDSGLQDTRRGCDGRVIGNPSSLVEVSSPSGSD